MITNEKINQLQFLRFCAFLLICVFHTGQSQFSWCQNGNSAANAVSFFIVLSGFVSGYSSYQVNIECDLKGIVVYICGKLKKIYPLYFVTMLFTIGYSGIPNLIATHSYGALKVPLIQLLKCLLLIQSWFPSGYFSFNGVGWFLSTIMFLYLLNLPLRTMATKIKKKNHIYFALTFVCSFAITDLYCYLTRNTNMEYFQYVLPLSRIGEYICGMVLGYLSFSINLKFEESKKEVLRIIFSLLEILAIVLWIYGMCYPVKPWHYRIVHWIIPNCFIIMVFSFGRGILSSIFAIDFLRYLGEISFECFLIHQIIIYIYQSLSGLSVTNRLGNVFSICFCVTLTVMIAMLISKSGALFYVNHKR